MEKKFNLKQKTEWFKKSGFVEFTDEELDGETGIVFKYDKRFPLLMVCETVFEGSVNDDVIEYNPELSPVKDIDEAATMIEKMVKQHADDFELGFKFEENGDVFYADGSDEDCDEDEDCNED